MNNILEGLKIIEKYDPDFETCAEHDKFYAGLGLKVIPCCMKEEDSTKLLEELGWKWDGESWFHFT